MAKLSSNYRDSCAKAITSQHFQLIPLLRHCHTPEFVRLLFRQPETKLLIKLSSCSKPLFRPEKNRPIALFPTKTQCVFNKHSAEPQPAK